MVPVRTDPQRMDPHPRWSGITTVAEHSARAAGSCGVLVAVVGFATFDGMESAVPQVVWPVRGLPQVFRAGCSTQDDRGFARTYRNSQLTVHLFAYAATVRIGDQAFRVEPGDLTLTPPDAVESFDLTRNGFHWYLRLVPVAGAPGARLSLPLHHRLGRDAVEARHRFETITRDFHAAGGGAEHPAAWAAAAGSQALLCWLAARASPGARPSPVEAGVAKAMALLDTPECASLSIAEVSRRAGLSQNRLARAFLARHGMTMGEYRTRRLVEVAKWLMESSDLSLADIRRRITIADPQRFNKLFRRVTGRSPRDWLEAHAPVTASAPLPPVAVRSGSAVRRSPKREASP